MYCLLPISLWSLAPMTLGVRKCEVSGCATRREATAHRDYCILLIAYCLLRLVKLCVISLNQTSEVCPLPSIAAFRSKTSQVATDENSITKRFAVL